MINDAALKLVPSGSPLSLVAADGVDIPSPYVIDLLGDGAGTEVRNIWGNSTVPGQADGMGVGRSRPELAIVIGTALATSNSATLNVQWQGAPDDGTGSPGTYQTYGESGPITAAQGIAGRTIARLPFLPPFPITNRPRFLRLNFEIPASTHFTAGTIAAANVVMTRDDYYVSQQPANYTAVRSFS